MHSSDMAMAIEEYKREKWTYAKTEETRREVDAVIRMVDRLEHSLREACAEIAGLRDRVQELEANQLAGVSK